MKSVCEEYLSDAKSFFPVIGKQEKAYLKDISNKIEWFCKDNDISTKEELYEQYGKPYLIAYDYYELNDKQKIIKKIRLSKTIKLLVLIILAAIAVISTISVIYNNQINQMFTRMDALFYEDAKNEKITYNTETFSIPE